VRSDGKGRGLKGILRVAGGGRGGGRGEGGASCGQKVSTVPYFGDEVNLEGVVEMGVHGEGLQKESHQVPGGGHRGAALLWVDRKGDRGGGSGGSVKRGGSPWGFYKF